MKTPKGYKLVLDAIDRKDRAAKALIEEGLDASITKILALKQEYAIRVACLKFATEMLFESLTAEEVQAIVEEQEIDTNYSWKDGKFKRDVLPKEVYCTHKEYQENLKLRLLMPNKVFH